MKSTNLAKAFLALAFRAAKAKKKTNAGSGGIVYEIDLKGKQVSGTFVIPITESVDLENGEITIQALDFLEESLENGEKVH